MRRREFLPVLAAAGVSRSAWAAVNVRAITKGPRFHWFGYYDKLQFDPVQPVCAGHGVDFEHRSPTPDDIIRVGVIDPRDDDHWTELGSTAPGAGSRAACCSGSPVRRRMSSGTIGRRSVHRQNLTSRPVRSARCPRLLHFEPRWQVGDLPRFRRLNDCRPGYGYAGILRSESQCCAPSDAGIWHMDIATGRHKAAHSVFARPNVIPYPNGYPAGAKHWFNHLLYSTDGSRFIFLHRWRGEAGRFQSSPHACSRRTARGRTCTYSIRTAGPRISSGATRSTSWLGPGIPPTGRSSTSIATGPITSRWSAPSHDSQRPLHLPSREQVHLE